MKRLLMRTGWWLMGFPYDRRWLGLWRQVYRLGARVYNLGYR